MSDDFDLPQADRLDLVRAVVELISQGIVSSTEIAARGLLASRYVQYSLRAARIIGLLDDSAPPHVTSRGQTLLNTPARSPQERDVLAAAVGESNVLPPRAREFVLGADIASSQLTDELLEQLGGAESTVRRRVTTLSSWKKYLRDEEQIDASVQLSMLFDADTSDVELDESLSSDAVDAGALMPSDAPNAALFAFDDGASRGSEHEPVNQELDAPAHRAALPDSVEPEIAASTPGEPSPFVGADDVGARGEPDATSLTETSESRLPEGLSEGDVAYLRRHFERGTAYLFTGAGFSLDAVDTAGTRLPTGAQFCQEVWNLLYPDDPYDGSSLPDVFEAARIRQRRRLETLMSRRFTVGSGTPMDVYRSIFSLAWRRAYTLNVDDLADAVDRRCELPRRIRSLSALDRGVPSTERGGLTLDVVHLNGVASGGVDGVTFSTREYMERISRQDPIYATLAAELFARAFVFVGSPIDEPLFWSHITLREQRSSFAEREQRAKSFLVVPSLPRARADMLAAYNVVWVKATLGEFVRDVVPLLEPSSAQGFVALEAERRQGISTPSNIVEVSEALLESPSRSNYLVGDEPTWSDVRDGRAVDREEDGDRLAKWAELAVRAPGPNDPVPVVVVSATAGAGKTTLLMKAASRLQRAGARVAWIGSSAEVSPRTLVSFCSGLTQPTAIVIDDAGRYGRALAQLLVDVVKSEFVRMVIIAQRSGVGTPIDSLTAAGLSVTREGIGPLLDPDIDRLIDALDREKRLGVLRGRPRKEQQAVFRDKSDRQILVAMIEATSGKQFDTKIVEEYAELDPTSQYIYALCALGTVFKYPLSSVEVLLAFGAPDDRQRDLRSIRGLVGSHLLRESPTGQLSLRHLVVAEKLLTELTQRGTHIQNLIVGFARSICTSMGPSGRKTSRQSRVLRRVISHDNLLSLLKSVDAAQQVYASLEELLDQDHHFWLQRGCLELDSGSLPLAENFLRQAVALSEHDPLVDTAFAHMELRKTITNPTAPGAIERADAGFAELRRLVGLRARVDHYPAHVFGIQMRAWIRSAGDALPMARKRTLLREAREIVGNALAIHRGRTELRHLLDDLKREELTLGIYV